MKTKIYSLFAIMTLSLTAWSQGVGVNETGANPDPSAILDASSTNKGFLAPRMTSAQRDAISSPAKGLTIFNTDDNLMQVNTGTPATPVWQNVSPGATGAQGPAGPAPAGTGIVTVNGGNLQTPGTLTGDVTTTGSGLATTITNGAVTAVKLNQMGATSGQALVWNGTAWVPTAVATSNIYTASGTLTGFRNINQNGHNIVLSGTGNFSKTSGNVGIGTSTPSEILTVRSPIDVGATWAPVFYGRNATGNVNTIQLRVRDNITDIAAGLDGTGGTANLSFSLATSPNGSPVERMRIGNNGNVGIGTASPTERLHVAGLARLQNSVYGNIIELNQQGSGDRNTFIDFHSSGAPASIDYNARILRQPGANGVLDIVQTGTGNMRFQTNGANTRMTITQAGNVGIGTSAPIQALDVNGRVNITNGVIQRGGAAITATSDLGLYSRTVDNWLRFVTNNGDMVFFTANGTNGAGENERMRITAGGNIGLGTNAPSQRLDVNGQIRIRGGSPAAGRVLVSDANGVGTWTALNASNVAGINQAVTMQLSGGNNPVSLSSNSEEYQVTNPKGEFVTCTCLNTSGSGNVTAILDATIQVFPVASSYRELSSHTGGGSAQTAPFYFPKDARVRCRFSSSTFGSVGFRSLDRRIVL